METRLVVRFGGLCCGKERTNPFQNNGDENRQRDTPAICVCEQLNMAATLMTPPMHQSVTKPTTIQPILIVYSPNHLHVLTRFGASYCIILSAILTHSYSWYAVLYAHFSIFSTVF